MYKKAYLRTFEQMLKVRTIEKSGAYRWRNAEDVYQWWLFGNEKSEEPVPGQISIILSGAEAILMKNKSEITEGKTYEEWKTEFFNQKYEYEKIKEYGADKMWADGVELNQIHNKILEIARTLGEYGDTLDPEIPEAVAADYMAKADEIKTQAEFAVNAYKRNEDYIYLCKRSSGLSERQKEVSGLREVLGRIKGLREALDKEDFVIMRDYGQEGRFDNLLHKVAERVGKISETQAVPAEKNVTNSPFEGDYEVEGQISIYDLAS